MQRTLDGTTRLVNVKELHDVYIGRPGEFGNPFSSGTKAENIENYRIWILGQPKLLTEIRKLRGKTIACWCPPEPCHGDVIIQICDGTREPLGDRTQ